MTAADYSDVDLKWLLVRRIAVLWTGEFAGRQASVLHDGGFTVMLGLEPFDKLADQVHSLGLVAGPADLSIQQSDVIVLPEADLHHVYAEPLIQHLKPGDAFIVGSAFAHRRLHFTPIRLADVCIVELQPHRRPPRWAIQVVQDASGHARTRALAYAFATGADPSHIHEP